ncbi:MAG TPA: serine--tRNA ligase [Actinomycetota bacterium]|nr:serine--tRNA ligase [Actinomycetota bacterium]
MLDLRAIREDPGPFRRGLARRGAGGLLDRLLERDAVHRELTGRVEELRARRNRASKEIGRAEGEDRERLIRDVKEISAQLDRLEPELEEARAEVERLLAELPNVPHESVPDGETEEDNVELKRVGEPPGFGFPPLDHVALGERLGLLDMERGAKVSGSRFVYLLGPAVLVQFALVRYALDRLVEEGFTPVVPPVLVRETALFGTGFLPGGREQIYEVPEDELFLVGTSEVSLAAFHADEILDPDALPLRYAGYSTCFRREAGTYGKDTRGMFRVHQFDKVEMFVFARPEDSWEEHERLVAIEEELVGGLGLPYRLVNVCVGELGAPAAKKVDLEVWLPGQGRYRELTSCSNTTDFQARRLGIRMRAEGGNVPVHTLNGTAVAIGRTLIALLENHQRADGSVPMPPALHPYLPEQARTLVPAGA